VGVADRRPRLPKTSTTGEILVFQIPIKRPLVGRIAWPLLRQPVKNKEFPAELERLVTPDELMRYGF
jgi:hypothetical protein